MKNIKLICFLLFGASMSFAQTNVLTNGDFNAGPAGGGTPTGWAFLNGNGFTDATGNPLPFESPIPDANNDPYVYKMFGTFPAFDPGFCGFIGAPGPSCCGAPGAFGQSLIGQFGFPCVVGDIVQAGIDMISLSSDRISGSNIAFIRVAFFDAAGNEILGVNSANFDASTPPDAWSTFNVSATAPAGAVTSGYFVFFQQLDGCAGGSVFYDNAFMTKAQPVPTMGQWGLTILCLSLMALSIGVVYQRKTRLA